MRPNESSDRTTVSLVLFALGFAGFWVAAAGVIADRPWLALGGGLVVLGVLLLFLANHWLDGDFMA